MYTLRNWFFLLILWLLAIPSLVSAQQRSMSYGATTNVFSAVGEELPFWFYANTDGLVSQKSPGWTSSIYSHYGYHSEDKSLRLSSGFDLNSRLSKNNALFFSQLYGELGYRFLNLKVGRFIDTIGMTDDDLTMGSMQVSRNATPVPKVQLETEGFTNVPLTQGYVQFKSMLAHGWLEDDRFVKNAYLHQKYFYLKINYKMLEAIGGMIHNVIYGGTHPSYGDLPSSFNDYLRVFTGSAAAKDSNAPRSGVMNAIGNMVAAYDFRVNVNFDEFIFKAYRQFFLEDRVAAQFRSPWDGIWGAGIELTDQNSWVNEILWEHMSTKRQDAFDYEPRGMSSYYNHGTYKSGWAYENRVFGNPLLIYGPNNNFVGQRAVSNNIIVAHHIAIKGEPSNRFSYKALLTYSRNYGTKADQTQGTSLTPIREFRVDEYSSLLRTKYLLAPSAGISLTTAVAFDIGKLYQENRLGFQVGLSWNKISL